MHEHAEMAEHDPAGNLTSDGEDGLLPVGRRTRISKRLSLVLRHRPDSIGISLDPAGWVDIDTLLSALAAHGLPLTRAHLDQVVATSDKQRFSIDPTGRLIRAAQGHSTSVDLGYPAQPPPQTLFHGTPESALPSIMRSGLTRQRRHAVHLSPDPRTAATVGARRGAHVVLVVDAASMARDGYLFCRADNGVWLTEAVPARYLRQA